MSEPIKSEETQETEETQEKKKIDESSSGDTVESLRISLQEAENKTLKALQERDGVVEEIKAMRVKNRNKAFEKEEDNEEEKEEKEDKGISRDEIKSVINQELDERNKLASVGNRKSAFNKFCALHKEFHPDNDKQDVKFNALQKEFDKLNTNEHYSVEELLSDYENAYKLMMNVSTSTNSSTVPSEIASTPIPGGKPKEGEDNKLTAEQEKLRKESGWTVEHYLKMKQKYPNMIV